eukprot:scaffold8259_cov143-Cylindrotheca_fusiformis.AAC.8
MLEGVMDLLLGWSATAMVEFVEVAKHDGEVDVPRCRTQVVVSLRHFFSYYYLLLFDMFGGSAVSVQFSPQQAAIASVSFSFRRGELDIE